MAVKFKTMEEAAAYIDGTHERDPVDCAGCTACCRNNQAVALMPDDDPNLYGEENLALEMVGPETRLTLKRQPNGDCVFLRNSKCTIYDKRPKVCRAFDCRRIFHSFTKEQRREAVKANVFPQEVFDAGRKRLSTMQLDELEKEILQPGVCGAFLLGKVAR